MALIDAPAERINLALQPEARLHVELAPQAALEAELEPLRAAFKNGAADGLLLMAGLWPTRPLAASAAYWRDFTKLNLTRQIAQGGAPLSEAEAARWLQLAPAMTGSEHLDGAILQQLWQELLLLAGSLKPAQLPLQAHLAQHNPAWEMLGRLCLSLAEHRANPDHPFALMLTYTTRLSLNAKPQHAPIAKVLADLVASGHQDATRRLGAALTAAAECSAVLKELLADRRLLQPQMITSMQAYRLLQDLAALEQAGIMVRVPSAWNGQTPPRVRVEVEVGAAKKAAGVGVGALLDFRLRLALNGKELSDAQWEELRRGAGGLVMTNGQWAQVDPASLDTVLAGWRQIEAMVKQGGLSYAQALRLIHRVGRGVAAPRTGNGSDAASERLSEEWSEVHAGGELRTTLSALEAAKTATGIDLDGIVEATLRPYQKGGVQWLLALHAAGLGGCLADDMGLGKTLQVLAFFAVLKRDQAPGPAHLVVAPATLIHNWRAEAKRFTPQLKVYVAHPSVQGRASLSSGRDASAADLVVTTYGTLLRLPWLTQAAWNVVVLDEAQAIKNPQAQQTRATKTLRCQLRLALSGTPVENHSLDLWSLFDFLNPGLLGTAQEFQNFIRDRSESGRGLGPLRSLVQPYLLRRLKSDRRIAPDLPDKIEKRLHCQLTPTQAAVYQRVVDELAAALAATRPSAAVSASPQEHGSATRKPGDMQRKGAVLATVDGSVTPKTHGMQRQGVAPAAPGDTSATQKARDMQRKGAVLAALLQLKQVCDHPALLSGDGDFPLAGSGKLQRLVDIAGGIARAQEKLLVFTQFRTMTEVLHQHLARLFGRPGCVLHGETPVAMRQSLVDRFQDADGPPFFILSVKAGGTGLTLTAASHVVHFDRWWNPAVEDQATDRAYRIGQRRKVLVHKMICAGTIEARIDQMLAQKRALAQGLLGSAEHDEALTELSDDELLSLVRLDTREAVLEAD